MKHYAVRNKPAAAGPRAPGARPPSTEAGRCRPAAGHTHRGKSFAPSLPSIAGNVAAVGREYGKERMQVHRWMKQLRDRRRRVSVTYPSVPASETVHVMAEKLHEVAQAVHAHWRRVEKACVAFSTQFCTHPASTPPPEV